MIFNFIQIFTACNSKIKEQKTKYFQKSSQLKSFDVYNAPLPNVAESTDVELKNKESEEKIAREWKGNLRRD